MAVALAFPRKIKNQLLSSKSKVFLQKILLQKILLETICKTYSQNFGGNLLSSDHEIS